MDAVVGGSADRKELNHSWRMYAPRSPEALERTRLGERRRQPGAVALEPGDPVGVPQAPSPNAPDIAPIVPALPSNPTAQ